MNHIIFFFRLHKTTFASWIRDFSINGIFMTVFTGFTLASDAVLNFPITAIELPTDISENKVTMCTFFEIHLINITEYNHQILTFI